LSVAINVRGAHDAVFMVIVEDYPSTIREKEKLPQKILATALVPFWDEKFVAGLKSNLYLEIPPSQNRTLAEIPCTVRSYLT
jgi:hypothetical protein